MRARCAPGAAKTRCAEDFFRPPAAGLALVLTAELQARWSARLLACSGAGH